MNLYLVQHGTAVTKDIDPDRPLSPQGEQDVRQLAEFLDKCGVHVERLLHSGKLRARQTATILADKLLLDGEIEAVSDIDPNDSVAAFSPTARKFKQDTLLVGHLPFLAKLVAHLTTGNDELTIVDYTPGSIICLERKVENGWRIRWMLRPDLIK